MDPTAVTFDEEMKKNSTLKIEDIETFKNWHLKQRHLPPITDKEIVLFLNSCHYSMEQTKVTVDNYFTVRTHCPELFENMNADRVGMKNGNLIVDFFMLPNSTPEGSRVIFVKFAETDPSDFNFSDTCKSFIMASDLEHHYYGTSKGFLILFDMAGIQFGHTARLNILTMKKILYYLQDAMPVRLSGLHFVNTIPFMDTVLGMMKPFLKKDLSENLHLHTSDFSTLYPYVPQKMLPKDYPGGESPTIKQMREDHLKFLLNNKYWFLERERIQKVNEKLRPGKAKSAGEIWGVEGSFKKLSLD